MNTRVEAPANRQKVPAALWQMRPAARVDMTGTWGELEFVEATDLYPLCRFRCVAHGHEVLRGAREVRTSAKGGYGPRCTVCLAEANLRDSYLTSLVGTKLAHATVLDAQRVKSYRRCRILGACGHEHVVTLDYLRKQDRRGNVVLCRRCSRERQNREASEREIARMVNPDAAHPSFKICPLCCDLAHQVVGDQCRVCKLDRDPEAWRRA